MATRLMQRVGPHGIQLPGELVEQMGAREGQDVVIELTQSSIRILPAGLDAADIAERAATYVLDWVGDATTAGQPERLNDRWQVPVWLSYRAKRLGTLTYSLGGELLPDDSDAPETMRRRSGED